MQAQGYLDSPWPCEDGAPTRLQTARYLSALWCKRDWGCASHMLLYPHSGELVINDYRRWGEEVVVLAVQTGVEIARVLCFRRNRR